MTTLRAAAQQALEALENAEDQLAKPYSTGARCAITALRAALAEPTVNESLQVEPAAQMPAEIAATITTTDIARLETRRLTRLWQELGQMRWAGTDEGWDLAIEAVRRRLDEECQKVLDWKAQVDQSGVMATELLQKMQGRGHD